LEFLKAATRLPDLQIQSSIIFALSMMVLSGKGRDGASFHGALLSILPELTKDKDCYILSNKIVCTFHYLITNFLFFPTKNKKFVHQKTYQLPNVLYSSSTIPPYTSNN
jgi:hypothetical protein